MHKNAKNFKTAKPVAMLPYLIPPTDEVIDRMEAKWLYQQEVPAIREDVEGLYGRFTDWHYEIVNNLWDNITFKYYDSNPVRRRRKIPQARSSLDLLMDHLIFPTPDPLFDYYPGFDDDGWDYPEFDDRDVRDPVPCSNVGHIVHFEELPYSYDDFLHDCGPIAIETHDPEKELVMTMPLNGLRYHEKQAVLRTYR